MKPLAYACSGCSSAAQLANHLAVRLDRHGLAEMSCIAGVGGDVPSLVRTARSGRRIVAIDGCPLRCVRACLARHELTPSLQLTLTELGVHKRSGEDYDRAQADALFDALASQLASLGADLDDPQRPREPSPTRGTTL